MIKTKMESEIINRKMSLSSKVSSISSWEWLSKGKYNITSEMKRYNNVTREDVMRVYKQYIKNRKAVIMNVSPKNPFSDEELVLESFNPNSNLILKEDPQYKGASIKNQRVNMINVVETNNLNLKTKKPLTFLITTNQNLIME